MDMKYGFESKTAREFPSMVQLTITNVCDMSCYHCPHSEYIKRPDFKPSYMDMDLYRKIADEIGQHEDTSLRIFGWGEPLVHPQLVEMIRYAKDHNVGMTNLITNGLKLDKKLSTGLIEAGLDILEVSLDTLTRETYEKIRGSGRNFDRVVENVRRYVELRDELNGSTYVTVSIINQPKVKNELAQFIGHWSGLVDDVVTRPFHDFMGFAQDGDKIELPERYPCRCLWSRFNINSEGLVNVCFNDWFNESILGDVKDSDTTIEKIWKSKEYEKYRQSHLDGKPKGVCENCNDWIGASWELPYEVLIQKAKRKIEKRRKK